MLRSQTRRLEIPGFQGRTERRSGAPAIKPVPVSVDDASVADIEDAQMPAVRGEAVPHTPAISGPRYPILGMALVGKNGPELRQELIELLSDRELRERAPRRPVCVMCRLEGPGYDEPVLVNDISASGVRFMVQANVALDVNTIGSMSLRLRTPSGTKTLPVALVRRCGGDDQHTELACRFVEPTLEYSQIVSEVLSNIFGPETLNNE
jgi:hypothetical protein